MSERARVEAFHVMAKPAGPACNLDCTYCFYLEKGRLYPEVARWVMPDDVLESFVRQYLASHDTPVVSFTWQGGEPTLLGLAFFDRVVALQRQYAAGRRVENAIQTNGILVDDDWAAFLADHDFLVGVSVDGPEDIHDRYRVDRSGRGSFRSVMRGLEALRRRHVRFNTLTVVHRENARRPLDVYHALRESGSTFMQFIPVVERVVRRSGAGGPMLVGPGAPAAAAVSPWSVDPADYGAFLCAIFDEWVRRDVGRVFVRQFDVALESWCGMPSSVCVFAEECGRAVALEHNGDVYSCDHYVYPDYRLGNLTAVPIADLLASPQQTQFGRDKRERLPVECLECDVRFACHGECPKHRFVRSRNGSHDLNYLCAGYRRFFRHIDPAMRFMAGELAQRRPPANVMAWMHARDIEDKRRAAGRNDPCPCGSGKKVKKCCGAVTGANVAAG